MFGIELDAIKKIELGFCVVVLATAGYFFYSGTKVQKDMTVAAWTEPHPIGIDGRRPSPTNPEDPQRSRQVSVFVNNDGRLEFTEYPKRTDGTKAEIRFFHDAKKSAYDPPCPPSPMQVVKGYSDPVKRAIGMAVISAMEGRRYSLFERLFARTKELENWAAKYNELIDTLALVDTDVGAGTFEPTMYQKCLSALQEFRDAGTEDLRKDPKKRAAAQKVMEVTLPYVAKVQSKKLQHVEAFVDAVTAALNDTQKKRAVEIGKEVESGERVLRQGRTRVR